MSQIKSHQYGSDGAETLDTLVTKKGEWTAAARTAISAARRLRLVRVRMGVERPPLLLCDAVQCMERQMVVESARPRGVGAVGAERRENLNNNPAPGGQTGQKRR